MFTENVREAFRTVSFGRRLWLKIYAWTKFPTVPVYGGFPVKMRSHLGAPIPYDENLTPEQLQAKVYTSNKFELKDFDVFLVLGCKGFRRVNSQTPTNTWKHFVSFNGKDLHITSKRK